MRPRSSGDLSQLLRLTCHTADGAAGAALASKARSWTGGSATIDQMAGHRIYATSVSSVYPLYIAKAERKGRTKLEVDAVIQWLTGYSPLQMASQLERQVDLETFFANAPRPNPARALIKGVVCGVRVEDIEEPTMREIRYLDKLIDELAKGRPIEKILRRRSDLASGRPATSDNPSRG